MGVPHFYTWLVSRYPLIKSSYNPETAPLIDWLFLDLNGIIYKCATDDTSIFKDILKGKRFEEIFVNIFHQINEIIHLAQPKKLLYLAFDGVAPRAKMNQQRARRFKSARKYSELDLALQSLGILEKEEHFKNNSISPGTEFMYELNKQIKFFIQKKISEDERWRNLDIVFSGVDNPGEGEHKALEYIRRKVQEPNFDPNTSVCIYGPDADLIFLALTTHLPFVCILREQLKPRQKKSPATKRYQNVVKYDFLWINIFREYFDLEFRDLSSKMGDRYNIDHIIDDFVFLCFFIGNDFLPRVFCMDIKVGNFDILIEIFKEILVESDGYINEKGIINWNRAIKLFQKIAKFELKFIGDKLEEQIVQQRHAMKTKNSKNKHNDYDDDEDDEYESNLKLNNEEVDATQDDSDEEEDYEGADNIDGNEDETEIKVSKKVNQKNDPEKLKKLQEKMKRTESNPSKEIEVIKPAETVENLKYIETNANEELTHRILSATVLEKDIKFMESLVNVYKMNASEARKLYYLEKFGINTDFLGSELTKILTAYMQGLQFVLSYYYTNCPSWSWYYPYYYSPLVSDLSLLMTHLKLPEKVETNFISFDIGKPYDPFKQLLLILPISNNHLLPEPLRKVVSDPNNPLNKYYPTEFELDPFGAVFDSEYIAKIPFVDENLLSNEYEKAIKNITSEDSLRNDHHENLLYIYDKNMDPYIIESDLQLYYDKFESRAKVQHFDLFKMEFDPKKILDQPPKGAEKIHLSFPSLTYIDIKKSEMKKFSKRDATFNKCAITLYDPFAKADLLEVVNKYYYFNYPFLKECYLLAIVTNQDLITKERYNDLPFPYRKADHKNFYLDMSQNIIDEFFDSQGILFEKTDLNFAIVQYQDEPRKDSEGKIFWPNPQWVSIPLNLIIITSKIPTYRGWIDFKPKKLEKEFPVGAEVALVSLSGAQMPSGATCKIIGYKTSTLGKNIKVEILNLVPNLNAIIRNLTQRYDNQTSYRDCRSVAKEIGIDIEVLHILFDSVIVKSDPEDNMKSIYPEKFDIGLGWIQKKYHTIVPELIICHDLDNRKKNRAFPEFQLAPEAVSVIKEYLKKYPSIFSALQYQIESRDYKVLRAKDIYPSAKNPNLEVFKIFIWIMKQDSSNLVVANKASKVIPRQGIIELEKILDNRSLLLGENEKKLIGKTFDYNPNALILKNHDVWIPPFFNKMPQWHKIGDRIINLKTTGYNFAPFGASGTVVGILGNKREENGIYEVKIEVLFDKAFIGGTNLGGRCKWGRGAVVDFDDIFNISTWNNVIYPRDKNYDTERGWDGHFSRPYIPQFDVRSGNEQIEEAKNVGEKITPKQQPQDQIQNQWSEKATTSTGSNVPKTIKSRKQDEKKQESVESNKVANKGVLVSDLEGSKTQSSEKNSSYDLNAFISNNLQVKSLVTTNQTKEETKISFDSNVQNFIQSNKESDPKISQLSDPAILSVGESQKPNNTSSLEENLKKMLITEDEKSKPVVEEKVQTQSPEEFQNLISKLNISK